MPYNVTALEHIEPNIFGVTLNDGTKIVVTHLHELTAAQMQTEVFRGIAETLAKWHCQCLYGEVIDWRVKDLLDLAHSEWFTGLAE